MTHPRAAVLAAVRADLADLDRGPALGAGTADVSTAGPLAGTAGVSTAGPLAGTAERGVVATGAQAAPLVLVACSGGPDSIALAAATARVASGIGVGAGAVIVDHGLQPGSDEVAASAAATCRTLGLAPVIVVAAEVRPAGDGPEAAARTARYRALDGAADRLGAACLLLGHTADDQAETVLLGLARGGGARALAGMPARRGRYRRPLLGLPRDVVRAAFPDLAAWQDPHNTDPRFTRSRVRQRVLPFLDAELAPGISAALARTAEQVRQEVAAVDAWADALTREHVVLRPDGSVAVAAKPLAALPPAVVVRVLRRAADAAGADGSRLGRTHLGALSALVLDWHGQGGVDLPGNVIATRSSGTVGLAARRHRIGAAPADEGACERGTE